MSEDLFVAKSDPSDALVSPLHTITYVTKDKTTLTRTLTEGLNLEATDWMTPSDEERDAIGPYLGIPAPLTWSACSFFRRGDAANIQIRVIALNDETPVVRPSIDGRYIGGLSIGFPMSDLPAHEAQMKALGVDSSVGVKKMEFTGPTGDVYVSAEIHFMAAENVFLLGVQRPDCFVSVGPIDSDTGIGAPAYSARCVSNPEAVNQFLHEVLGYEIRRDATFDVVAPSGLRLETGMSERFIQAFAPGANTGYLVLLDHLDENIETPAPTQGPPSRGMTMWSFSTTDLDTVHARALDAKLRILQAPAERMSPFLPQARCMIIEDPSGFPIEIFASD